MGLRASGAGLSDLVGGLQVGLVTSEVEKAEKELPSECATRWPYYHGEY